MKFRACLAIFIALGLALGMTVSVFAESSLSSRFPAISPDALDALKRITVQSGGRRMPFDTYAREQVRTTLGHTRVGGADPVLVFLGILFEHEIWFKEPILKVRHHDVLAILGNKPGEYISAAGVFANQKFIERHDSIKSRQEEAEAKPNPTKVELTSEEKAILDLGHRVVQFQSLGRGFRIIPPPPGAERDIEKFLIEVGLAYDPSIAFRRFEAPWTTIDKDPKPMDFTQEAAMRLTEGTPESNKLWAAVQSRYDYTKAGHRVAAREAWSSMHESYLKRSDTDFSTASKSFAKALEAINPEALPSKSTIGLEISTNRFRPFFLATMLYLLAMCLFGIAIMTKTDGWYRASMIVLSLGFALHTFGIATRWILASRAPWGNLYEATMVIAWGALVFGIGFEAKHKTRLFGLTAAIFGWVAIAFADLLPVEFGNDIKPLPAVLNTWWIYIHTSSLLVAYGAFAISFGIGIAMWVKRHPLSWVGIRLGTNAVGLVGFWVVVLCWTGRSMPGMDMYLGGLNLNLPMFPLGLVGMGVLAWDWKTALAERDDDGVLGDYIYRVIQAGFVFLTIGTILGAVWANESWGRYWGWDPKETWAFITWLIYAVFLHGRMVGWLKGSRAAAISIIGFEAVMFTYLGVSFLLPGLHSYLN